MRFLYGFVGLLGLGLILGCGNEPRANAQAPEPVKALPATPELPKEIVGVWLPVSCQSDGAEQMGDKATREAVRLSIENGSHKLYYLTDPVEMKGQRLSSAAFVVDEKNGTFTLNITEGKKKGEKVHGIYELKEDTLKLCYGPADKARPEKFESLKGSDTFNEVWTRYKKK